MSDDRDRRASDPVGDVSRVDVRPEYDALARALCDRLLADFALATRARTVVGVAGESGSGKSVTASALARALTAADLPAAVLHQDDYFVRPPRANHAHRLIDLAHVGPHEVDLARLAADVAAFRACRPDLDVPLVDYAADRFTTRPLDCSTLAVLVVEGTYALLLDDLDVRLFLSATYEDTRERRRRRARDVDSPFVEQVLALEHRLIAPQGARADLVIDRDFVVRRGGPEAGTAGDR